MTNDSPVTDLTALEGPDDWVSLYLDGVGEDPFTDAEVCHAVCAAVHLSLGLDCFALDLQLSDPPTVRPDLIDGTRSAAEPIAPVTASGRSVAQGFSICLAVYDQAVSALSVDVSAVCDSSLAHACT